MKKLVAVALMAVVAALTVRADTLALWENDNLYTPESSTPVDAVAAGVSAGDLSLGAGLVAPGSTWENALDSYIYTNVTTLAEAISSTHYFGFTVTPDAGKQVNYSNLFTRVTLNDAGDGAGSSVQVVLMSSVTGFTAGDEIGSFVATHASGQSPGEVTVNTHDFDISGIVDLQEQPSPIEFRLYIVPNGGSYSRVALGHIFYPNGTDDVRIDGIVEDATTLPTIELAMWQFDSLSGSETNAAVDTVATGVTAGDFAQSYRWFNGLALWPNCMWALISDLPEVTNLVTSITEDRYYSFTVKPDAGKIVDYKNIAARVTMNSAGGAGTSADVVLMSSLTGFTDGDEIGSFVAVHNPADPNATDNGLMAMDISGVAELQDITGEVEFRLYVILNDENSNRMGFGHIFWSDGADDILVEGTLEDAPVEPTKPATIVSIAPFSSTIMKVVIDAPDAPENYSPVATLNLIPLGWGAVAHSDDGVNPFVVTNLTYSSVEGTNEVIYVQADETEKFFGVYHQ